eukprot:5095974-Prymnesium_polylepis.1
MARRRGQPGDGLSRVPAVPAWQAAVASRAAYSELCLLNCTRVPVSLPLPVCVKLISGLRAARGSVWTAPPRASSAATAQRSWCSRATIGRAMTTRPRCSAPCSMRASVVLVEASRCARLATAE